MLNGIPILCECVFLAIFICILVASAVVHRGVLMNCVCCSYVFFFNNSQLVDVFFYELVSPPSKIRFVYIFHSIKSTANVGKLLWPHLALSPTNTSFLPLCGFFVFANSFTATVFLFCAGFFDNLDDLCWFSKTRITLYFLVELIRQWFRLTNQQAIGAFVCIRCCCSRVFHRCGFLLFSSACSIGFSMHTHTSCVPMRLFSFV